MKTYSEKLRDPRWQKKRLEIFEADHFTCRVCSRNDKTLHVHHLYYEKGKEPWEYPNSALLTICESCHEVVPKLNYSRAFWDANLHETNLLDLALIIRFLKNHWDQDPKWIKLNKKWKTRTGEFFFEQLTFGLLQSVENESETPLAEQYYRWAMKEKKKYGG